MKKRTVKKVERKVIPQKVINRKKIVKPVVKNEEVNNFIEKPISTIHVMETKESEIITQPIVSTPEIQTQESNSMLDELMGETDKDNEPVNETSEDILNDFSNDELNKEQQSTSSSSEKITDKIHDTLTNDPEDWQNPSDFRKMCNVNAMMYVEGGAILLSFIGQMISGDWTPEGEKKYTPSEERRKLIRAPLAKKFELNKDHSKSTPMGALITAIIFTIIPIIIIAFKDRKNRIKIEAQNIENIRLKNELSNMSAENEILRKNGILQKPSKMNSSWPQPMNGFIVKTRGRHKKDCPCDKCNLKKTKSR